jgi:hypothetical protein
VRKSADTLPASIADKVEALKRKVEDERKYVLRKYR